MQDGKGRSVELKKTGLMPVFLLIENLVNCKTPDNPPNEIRAMLEILSIGAGRCGL